MVCRVRLSISRLARTPSMYDELQSQTSILLPNYPEELRHLGELRVTNSSVWNRTYLPIANRRTITEMFK